MTFKVISPVENRIPRISGPSVLLLPLARDRDLRYDTIINVRSKANMSQLNLPHATDN